MLLDLSDLLQVRHSPSEPFLARGLTEAQLCFCPLQSVDAASRVGSLCAQGDEFCVTRAWDLSRRGQLTGTAFSKDWCLSLRAA